MLEDLNPGGLFQESGFFSLGIIECAGRVAYYQNTGAWKYVAKRFEMILSISERPVSFFCLKRDIDLIPNRRTTESGVDNI